MDLLDTVSRTIATHSLLDRQDSVLVALSGGPDSVALLHLLTRLREKYQLKVGAVYINHQIRKRPALAEEQFCEALCIKLRVPLAIVREDIPQLAKRERKSIEETGRDFRYATFESLANEFGYTKIALGHHADDRVETVLFRIIRGTGRTGLAGIPIRREKIIRPLFDVTKEQILGYLGAHKLDFCLDLSNRKSEYARNFLRNKLIPEIKARLNPQFEQAIINLSETMSDEEEYLQDVAIQALSKSAQFTRGGKIQLDVPTFCEYTVWLRRRVLRYCLGISSGQTAIDRETIERLDRFVCSNERGCSLPGEVRADRYGDSLYFSRTQQKRFNLPIAPGNEIGVPSLAMLIRCWLGRPPRAKGPQKRQASKVYLDWEKIQPPMQVRSIRPGDRFQPLGMRGGKKVGDYLTDRKVPRIVRDEVPVIEDKQGIIWLVGFEIADRVKVGPTTGKVVIFEVDAAQEHDS